MGKRAKAYDAAVARSRLSWLCRAFGCLCVLVLLMLLGYLYMHLENTLSERCYAIDATQYNVRPRIADDALRSPEPFAFGRVCIDYEQRVVWWRITDAMGDGVDVGDVRVHGPLTATTPQTAPAILTLGTTRNAAAEFAGRVSIDRATGRNIVRNSELFYVAFFERDTNAEVARDALDKQLFDEV